MEKSKIEKLLMNRKQKLAATKQIKAKYPNDKQVQIVADATIADLEWVINFIECGGE